MGGFYGNITLKGPGQSRVAAALRGRRAMVAPGEGKYTVVFDSACDDQNIEAIQALASQLSRKFRCPAIAVLVHDDDVFAYLLYRVGELADSYNSAPSYFDFGSSKKSAGPAGGNAQTLCETFRVDRKPEVEHILRKHSGKRGYIFETERHQDLVRCLGLPAIAVGHVLASFKQGRKPQGLSAGQLMWAADPPPVEDLESRRDREFYEKLGAEDPSQPCKQDGCKRGSVPLSVLCKRHHFEMVQGRKCPFK